MTDRKIGSQLTEYYRDKAYFADLYRLATPIALQNLLTSSLSMVGSVMVGQLGDAPMAAVALAGQVFFLFNLILFGIASGSAMFTAQLWGSKDILNLRKVLGLCLLLGLLVATVFLFFSEVSSDQILEIFTEDTQVIILGSQYLQLYAWSFIFFAITSGFSAVLRSVGEVKLPMAVNVSALGLNLILNYGLIFGNLGFRPMGAQGAALSFVITRIVECLALVIIIYARKYPIAATLRELVSFNFSFVGKVFKPVLPVILNELLWSLAISTYSIVYARIGTTSIAAMNIISAVDNLAFVPIWGLSNAISIMTGNRIGAGEKDIAYKNVGRTIGITAVMALCMGGLILLARDLILHLYNVSPEVILNARYAMIVQGASMVVRSLNAILIVGMMRSGGDTRYSLFLDGVIIWLLGVPMAVLGGFILKLPVYWVFLMVMSEELTKCILGLRRYFTRKWIHDLAQTVTSLSGIEPTAAPIEPIL
jgi:putative MATE family efflux protein